MLGSKKDYIQKEEIKDVVRLLVSHKLLLQATITNDLPIGLTNWSEEIVYKEEKEYFIEDEPMKFFIENDFVIYWKKDNKINKKEE